MFLFYPLEYADGENNQQDERQYTIEELQGLPHTGPPGKHLTGNRREYPEGQVEQDQHGKHIEAEKILPVKAFPRADRKLASSRSGQSKNAKNIERNQYDGYR